MFWAHIARTTPQSTLILHRVSLIHSLTHSVPWLSSLGGHEGRGSRSPSPCGSGTNWHYNSSHGVQWRKGKVSDFWRSGVIRVVSRHIFSLKRIITPISHKDPMFILMKEEAMCLWHGNIYSHALCILSNLGNLGVNKGISSGDGVKKQSNEMPIAPWTFFPRTFFHNFDNEWGILMWIYRIKCLD